ncbi:transcription initiation factor IID, TAF10 subunit [Rhizophagus irregularis]|uniref:Transcription initiation factor TFIID subunit 10 n=3 Tax=Rhizophagus irregularis TaxID=588596 RepID=A0A2I1H0M0_9GLOM|eukprot:XP_025173886.1 putative transcription initiation factor IID TAF10 subunit [Rhizophagus irregularis DAOM 181602=DAOM 197198]
MDFDNDSDEQHIYNIDKGKGKEVETPEPVEEENILPESVEDTESSEEEESTVISPSRREEEFIRKDRSLLDFLRILDGFEPLIPDHVSEYYLSRSGASCDDIRVMRLMSLAAQKFVADIATDAFQYCKIRQQSKKNLGKQRNKTVLNLEDLAAALSEYGINVKKPDYYRA